jgi:hypothetical protein
MKSSIVTVLILALASICWGADLPSAPTPTVEKDPVAWGITGIFAPVVVGTFTKPAIGFWAGIVIDIAGNSRFSAPGDKTNMVAAMVGTSAGYLLIKTLKRDWHKR